MGPAPGKAANELGDDVRRSIRSTCRRGRSEHRPGCATRPGPSEGENPEDRGWEAGGEVPVVRRLRDHPRLPLPRLRHQAATDLLTLRAGLKDVGDFLR